MTDLLATLTTTVGAAHVLTGAAISDDYSHDEALTVSPVMPAYVARPGTTAEVAALVAASIEFRVPITARGSGTGLSGACRPNSDSLVVSFERMNAILEIDTENYVAVVQPGVSLDQLDTALAPLGLVYPVCPGAVSYTHLTLPTKRIV